MPLGTANFMKIVLAWLLVLGGIGEAAATSCTAYTQRYFIVCDAGGCKAAFSVREIASFGACSRRQVVEDADPQVSAYLGKLATEIYPSDARGLFLLKLSSQYWGAPKPNKFDRLMDELQESLPLTSDFEQCKPRDMSVAQIGGLLTEKDAKVSLLLVTDAFSPRAVEAKRADFEAEEKHGLLQSILLSVLYWGSSIIALLALIHSVHLFFVRLYDKHRKGSFALWIPVATQLAIAAVGVVAAMLSPSDFWMGSLLVPAAVVILLCEGWARFRIGSTAPCPSGASDGSGMP
jgi:hypothetical protein